MRSAILAACVALSALSAPAFAGQPIQLEAVCFTPGGDCTQVIVDQIAGARSQILVQAYSFTSAPIAQALVQAKKRGVDVRAILDKSQRSERYSGADYLANGGVPVLIDAKHAIAHNKIVIVDSEVVVTGSFNFTKAAQEKNAENLVVLRDKGLAERYAENWQMHAGHSEAYRGRGE